MIAAGVANHPLDGAFIVPLARPTIAIPKQVMRLQAAEQRGTDAPTIRLDL